MQAPPAGSTPDIWEGDQRVVVGVDRTIDGRTEVLVWAAAVQYADGSLRQRVVHVGANGYDSLTIDQARALAAQVIEAADEIDRWVNT